MDESGYVERMNVVANLLPLIAENLVRAALDIAFDQVAEESVKLDARVIRSGQATAAEAAVSCQNIGHIPAP